MIAINYYGQKFMAKRGSDYIETDKDLNVFTFSGFAPPVYSLEHALLDKPISNEEKYEDYEIIGKLDISKLPRWTKFDYKTSRSMVCMNTIGTKEIKWADEEFFH